MFPSPTRKYLVFTSTILAVFGPAACSEMTAPQRHPPASAQQNVSLQDWFNCATWDHGGTWYCDYIGTLGSPGVSWSAEPDEPEIMLLHQSCDTDPSNCEGASPPSVYDPPPSDQDRIAVTGAIDCRYYQPDATRRTYCTAKIPDYDRKNRYVAALAAIRARGGPCVELADLGETLLNSGRMRVFVKGVSPNYLNDGGGSPLGGALPQNGGWNGPDAWMVSDAVWADYYSQKTATSVMADGTPIKRNFQTHLAHELDHLLGRDHSDPEGKWYTPNQQFCGGV